MGWRSSWEFYIRQQENGLWYWVKFKQKRLKSPPPQWHNSFNIATHTCCSKATPNRDTPCEFMSLSHSNYPTITVSSICAIALLCPETIVPCGNASGLYVFLPFLPQWLLSLGGKGLWSRYPNLRWAFYNLLFSALWSVVAFCAHLWGGLTDRLIWVSSPCGSNGKVRGGKWNRIWWVPRAAELYFEFQS